MGSSLIHTSNTHHRHSKTPPVPLSGLKFDIRDGHVLPYRAGHRGHLQIKRGKRIVRKRNIRPNGHRRQGQRQRNIADNDENQHQHQHQSKTRTLLLYALLGAVVGAVWL